VAALNQRCADEARLSGADPAGFATFAPSFLLIEVARPWPQEIAEHPALRGVADMAARIGARVQAIVPANDLPDDLTRVTLYSHNGGPFLRYERRETEVALERLDDELDLLASRPVGTAGAAVDLLLCTHGARDRCCGSLGTRLAFGQAGRDGVRVLQTSHLGGHRFAPTGLVLPSGTMWAWLDDRVLDSVLNRSGEVCELLAHYRGSTALATSELQFAERAVFAAVGWQWLDHPRTGEVLGTEGARTELRISSPLGTWDAVVERLGSRPQPVCGAGRPDSPKLDPVLRLTDLGRVA